MLLQFSSIIHLEQDQTLFRINDTDTFVYFVLFGKLILLGSESEQVGELINVGWTVGEEVIFKQSADAQGFKVRHETCISLNNSCVLGIHKNKIGKMRKLLAEQDWQQDYLTLDVILRGNYFIKQKWRKRHRRGGSIDGS